MPPPPMLALLFIRLQLRTVTVPSLAIPPPKLLMPFSIVSPEMVATASGGIEKTELFPPPLTASSPAPGPAMVRVIGEPVGRLMGPLVRVMTLPGQDDNGEANVTVSKDRAPDTN